jgi:hypothetical protein
MKNSAQTKKRDFLLWLEENDQQKAISMPAIADSFRAASPPAITFSRETKENRFKFEANQKADGS